jgi:hypothetical protein
MRQPLSARGAGSHGSAWLAQPGRLLPGRLLGMQLPLTPRLPEGVRLALAQTPQRTHTIP